MNDGTDRLVTAARRIAELEEQVAALEAEAEDLRTTVASYRRRELNQQEAREYGRKAPARCQSVSNSGTACALDHGHDGAHRREMDGCVRSWGG